jgi:hypothetical protein
MKPGRWGLLCAGALVSTLAVLQAGGQPQPLQPQALQPPPKTLKPLLTPRRSEMRFVAMRYTLDRVTLNGNYLEGMRAGMRPGPGAPPATPREPLSANRIGRLRRFDLDWQAALTKIDPKVLTPAAQADLTALNTAITDNLAQLDADTASLNRVYPLVPFSSDIIKLIEARIQVREIDPQATAAALTVLTRDIQRMKARLDGGLAAAPSADAIRPGKELALQGAVAVEQLRAGLNEWFTFFNGYDPLFTWWVGLPFKHVDEALLDYATLLKEKVATASVGTPNLPKVAPMAIPPAPAPAFASVPNLQELMALPQDEMIDIVQRFLNLPTRLPLGAVRAGAQRLVPPEDDDDETLPAGGPGVLAAPGKPKAAKPGAAAPAAPAKTTAVVRDRAFYEAWLKALKTLDFAKLGRNAQVDYLYVKKIAELQIAHAAVVLPPDPPRKTDESGIKGPARGRQGLILDLEDELIPYTPEELITFAESELKWCEGEMKKASAQLGFGDNWMAALEKTKTITPPPGRQSYVVRDLVQEGIDYLRAKDLMTVPAVAAESQHMIMMTPERQLVNPFYTGGSEISVSYPTNTMEYEARMQSIRGNNTPASHATAFHEMIPGHNLVFYTTPRYVGYRARLGRETAFYHEGWPLYWEMMMYQKGFHDTPEKKIGALFWRMHRCARIVFSMKFHLGEWSPQQCIDFLVARVGFERANAIGEVRRSFDTSYGPLYQAAYLLGGIQIRSLRHDLVDSGVMSEKAFHDEILRQGPMPIAMLRLAVGRQPLTRDMVVDWRFLEGTRD